MKKYLTAERVKDNYYQVKIITSLSVDHIDEVLDIIRYEGLKFKKAFSEKDKEGKYKRIFAE